MNWKTILVPHDFSSSANHAAAIARDEAKHHGGRIVLLHVIELPHQLDADALVTGENGEMRSLRDYAMSKADEHLSDLAERLGKDGVQATPIVKIGVPIDEIEQAIDEHEIDVVVMGTHGRTGIRHLIAGSVAERVVRMSKVPVLTIRQPNPSLE
jgi:nucleotide-binding universal stress UspA family protein